MVPQSMITSITMNTTASTLSYGIPLWIDIVKAVQELGNEVLLSKIDVSRAFRNLRVDPFEYDALGLSWDGKSYIDISIPMGMKTGSALCQRTTDGHTSRHAVQETCASTIILTTSFVCISVTMRVRNLTLFTHSLSFWDCPSTLRR